MSLFHSLGQLLARNSQSNKSHTRRRKRTLHGKRGLRFEALEDRSMLATIVVTSLADNTTVDMFVTLREALIAANTDSAVDGSTAGSGADTITFAPSLTAGGPATINLGITGDNTFGPSALLITSDVTITGPTGANGITIGRDAAAAPVRLRLFNVGQTGSLTLNNLTLTGGVALGGNGDLGGGGGLGAGGAIVNQGALIVNASTFTGNRAQGGNGGAAGANAGGGMGGDALGLSGGGPNGGVASNGGFGGGGGQTFNGGFGGGGGGGGVGNGGGFGGGGGGQGGVGGFGGGNGDVVGVGGGGAGLGGAIFNYGGTIDITNSTFANDAAIGGTAGGALAINGSGLGSEIFNLNGTVFLLNATLVNTNANAGLYAIINLGDNGVVTQAGPVLPATTAHVDIYNSILRNTSGQDYFSGTRNGGTVLTTGSNTFITNGYTPGPNFNLQNPLFGNPLLGALGSNGGPTQTILPASNSPVLNAGISSANEVQTLTVGGGAGTFALTFNGQTTGALAFNVPASGGVGPTASVQNALTALTSISGVSGSVTVTQAAGVYTITFGGTLANSNQPLITTTAAGGATAAVTDFTRGFTLPATEQRGAGFNRIVGAAVELGAVEQLAAPSVTNNAPTLITTTSATLGGTIVNGESPITAQGVVLALTATNNNPQIGGLGVTMVSAALTPNTFSVVAPGLQTGSAYTFASFVTTALGTVYAPVGTFTTFPNVGQLAGVTVQVVGTQLIITGDNTADQLKLVGTANANEFIVTGLNGTVVNGVANNAVTTQGVNSITWNLTNGADVITMDNAVVAGSVTIGGGSGAKNITLGNVAAVRVGGNLSINGGNGNGVIFVNATTCVGAMAITGGSGIGNNTITTAFSNTGGNLTITGGAGYDLVQQTQVAVGAAWTINVVAGNDLISVAQCSANGAATFISGLGYDTIAIAGSQLRGGVTMDGSAGGGFKTLNLYSTFYTGAATLTGGAQNDTLVFNNNTGGSATLNSGAGLDTVSVLTSVLNSLFADLGDGNDTLTVRGTSSTIRPSFNGGIGIDTYTRSGNAFPGVTLSSFETQTGTGY